MVTKLRGWASWWGVVGVFFFFVGFLRVSWLVFFFWCVGFLWLCCLVWVFVGCFFVFFLFLLGFGGFFVFSFFFVVFWSFDRARTWLLFFCSFLGFFCVRFVVLVFWAECLFVILCCGFCVGGWFGLCGFLVFFFLFFFFFVGVFFVVGFCFWLLWPLEHQFAPRASPQYLSQRRLLSLLGGLDSLPA